MPRFLLAALVASLCILTSCAPKTPPVPANPASDFITYIEDDGVVISGFCGRDATVVVPAEIDGRPVKALSEGAFDGRDWLTSISLPDGLQTIGEMAFTGCDSLSSFAVSSGNSRFQAIDGVLFTADGKALVAFPPGKKATEYQIPDGAEKIGEHAFWGCNSLMLVSLPDGLKIIGESAFACCESLTSVVFPDTLKTIGDKAFYGCDSLDSFTVSSGNSQFQAVDGVLFTADGKTLVAFPPGKKATEYQIPDGVEKIGASAFKWCESLTSVALPDGLKIIGENAFTGCDSLTSVALPDGLQTIGESAFSDCRALTSVVVPDGLQTIGEGAFTECDSLDSFTVSSGNSQFQAVDGVLFTADGKTLVAFPPGKKATEYQIPDGVEKIDEYAFWGCNSLTSVSFPDGLQTIGNGAFEYCLLSSVLLPDGLKTIGENAFAFCSLMSVSFPDGLRTIGNDAFYDCDSLTSVKIPDSVEKIGKNAFDGCDVLTLYGAVGSVAEEYARENQLRFEAR